MTDPLDMRHLCGWCGSEMRGRRWDTIYCTPACNQAAYKDFLRRERLKDKANRAPCQNCGAAIPASALVTAVFCSRSCKEQARNRRVGLRFKAARQGRACAVCGSSLDDVRKDAIYCGATCRERAKWERKTARKRSQTTD